MSDYCAYCSTEWCKISHGGKCPKVKSIEYYPDGTPKKVEFFEESYLDWLKKQPNQPPIEPVRPLYPEGYKNFSKAFTKLSPDELNSMIKRC